MSGYADKQQLVFVGSSEKCLSGLMKTRESVQTMIMSRKG